MAAWLADEIQPERREALAYVAKSFERVRNEANQEHGSSLFLERELEEIDQDCAQEIQQERKQHYDSNTDEYGVLEKMRSSLERVTREYNGLRDKHRRKPKLTSWKYFVALGVIMIPELIINVDTILAISFISTPAIAWAVTFLIAVALGVAAHYQGTLLKQYAALANPAKRTEKRQALKYFLIGSDYV